MNTKNNQQEILNYLATHGVDDKDQRSGAPRVRRAANPDDKKVEKMRNRTLRATLDLHGSYAEDAERRVRDAIDQCKRDGIKQLLIIHGYGKHSPLMQGPVLKTLVISLLQDELYDKIQDFHPAAGKDGGEGCTVVVL